MQIAEARKKRYDAHGNFGDLAGSERKRAGYISAALMKVTS